MSTRLFSRLWYRSRLFWLLTLLAVYLLVCFFLVPRLVQQGLQDGLRSEMAWESTLGEVHFHPLEWRLELNALSAIDHDSRKVLALDQLVIDFDWFSPFRRAWSLEELSLTKPYVRFDLYEDGTNFSRSRAEALSRKPPLDVEDEKEAADPEEATPSTVPRVFLELLALRDASLDFHDHTQPETVHHEFTRLDFRLDEFSTYQDIGDVHSLVVTWGEGQTLEWDGRINLPQSRAEGHILLRQLRLSGFQPYLKPHADYELLDGHFNVGSQYTLAWGEPELQLKLSGLHASVAGLDVGVKDRGSVLTWSELTLAESDFDLASMTLNMPGLTLSGLNLRAERLQDGALVPLLGLKESRSSSTSAEAGTGDKDDQSQEFRWTLGEFVLKEGGLLWKDQVPAQAAEIRISDLNVQVSGLSEDFSKPLPVKSGFSLQESGKAHIEGEVTPASGAAEVSLDLGQWPLPMLQPYIDEVAALTLQEGRVSLKGTLAADPGAEQLGRFEGEFQVEGLETRDQVLGEPLAGWQALTVSGIGLNLAPLGVEIREIDWSGPYAKIVIDDSGTMNLAKLARKPQAGSEEAESAEGDAATVESPESGQEDSSAAPTPLPDVDIRRFSLQGASFEFRDNTLDPAVDIVLKDFGGTISDLSSNNQARSDVDLSGMLEDQGQLTISGTVNPLSEQLYTDLKLGLSGFDMTELSPYTGKYVGNKVDKGQLLLDLQYRIDGTQLDASNEAVLDQFTLGDSVKSEDATSLPVGLAIALLKDLDGRIQLDVPVHGDLSDPEFRVGQVILDTLVNLITKAATSPFSLLGSIVEGGDELSTVLFEPGDAGLSDSAREKAGQLAEVMVAKPQLRLEIRGAASEKEDGGVLKQAIFDKRLAQWRSANPRASEREAYETLAREWAGSDVVDSAVAGDASESDQLAELARLSLDAIAVRKADLRRLASDRAANLRKQILAAGDVQAAQVFTLDPLVRPAFKGPVSLEVSLGAR